MTLSSDVRRVTTRVVRWGFALGLAAIAVLFFFYPAVVSIVAVTSSETREHARPPGLAGSFEKTCDRYVSWAEDYLESKRAAKVSSHDVAATEWPIFGSVFLLLAAEELALDGSVKLEGDVREAVDLAAEVVAHPATGTWVKTKWGESYLESENVFYRMLLLMGLESYQRTTGDRHYSDTIDQQAQSLGPELLAQPHYLADDYPGECYPNDVLWAVVSLKRAAAAGSWESNSAEALSRGLLGILEGPAKTSTGLPAFQVSAATAEPTQVARGSGNSGILTMAGELDPDLATRWFENYVEHYWVDDQWLWGFREMPHAADDFADVDSGPVLFGVGSVATGFGVGAARSVGRHDIAVPLVMETVPASWPTPFGLMLPGTLGWTAAGGWCFGELALHFSMTRPNRVDGLRPYGGGVPPMVWWFVGFYLLAGALLTVLSVRIALGSDRR